MDPSGKKLWSERGAKPERGIELEATADGASGGEVFSRTTGLPRFANHIEEQSLVGSYHLFPSERF
jgi:hypothetical protein